MSQTSKTIPESQRQKAEAESFLRRMQIEYPHLVTLGYQAIINVTVQGMKDLGIYHDSLTEAKFMAGLMHAMNTGVVPKPPERIVEVQAQPSPELLERERIARENDERERRYRAQFRDKRHNHAHDVAPKQSKENESAMAEKQAQERCSLIQGRTHAETAQISKLFVTNPDSSEINWIETEQARIKLARSGYRVRATNPRY
jgi:hypothetical protein